MSSVTSPQSISAAAPQHKQGTHHQRLARLRDQERQRRQIIIVTTALVMIMLLAVVLAVIDFYFELSATSRLALWGTIAVAVVGMAITRWRWLAFDSSDAVCEAERIWPEVGQRLRTSHDYQATPESVSPAHPELIQALESETQEQVTRQPAVPLGRPWPILVLLGLGGATAALWLVALMVWPQWRIATARLWFVPVHYSDVEMTPLPESLHQGDDLVLQLNVQGRPLESARVRYRQPGDNDWNEVDFQPAVAGVLVDELKAVIPECQNDLEVQVEAGPLATDSHLVAVRLPLVLEQWNASVKPPSYTNLPAAEGSPDGMRIPAGSQLDLEAQYNRQPNQVDVGVKPQTASTAEAELNDSVAKVSLVSLSEPTELQVKATASDGIADDSTLLLDVIPDRDPKLKFVAPAEEAEAVATAELLFTLEAFDDYGLSTVGIRYRIDDGPEQTLWENDSSDLTNAMANTVTLPLEDLNVSYPQAISYYAYAIDNREPEPQRITSELRFVDIRPFSREYEFKDGQCNGNCQGECLTLEKLIKQQRTILGQTFSAVQRGNTDDQVGTKLAAEEKDLRGKTEALTSALEEKVGPMPSLVFASGAMADAERELKAQSLSDGQVDEEHALAFLVAARNNLRKILKQCDSQSQMCRNVDQEQMDKLRKPEREQKQDQKQEQQVSDVRKQIEELAKQQQSFCQSASVCQKASQSSSSKSSSASSSSSANSKTATPEQLAEQQQQAAKEASDLQRALEEGMFGPLAPKRAEQAAKSIQRSGDAIDKDDDLTQAIEQARQAAEQLKRLSEHLGQRHNPDFVDKLAAAERQAQQLSEEQKRLSDSLSGRDKATENSNSDGATSPKEATTAKQQQLAERTEELADLVDQLLADSVDEDWEVQRELSEQTASNPPQSAASAMQQAAQGIEQGRLPSASEQGTKASALLERFAAGMREVQKASGLNRLDQLTKAERRSAALLKNLQRSSSSAEKAMAQAEASQFSEDLRPLAKSDGELARANQSLGAWNSLSSAKLENEEEERDLNDSPEFATSPRSMIDALRDVNVILQRRIQEAIVSGAMQQAVGAVPPGYTEMVDDYYRTLSEDIE